MTIAAFDTLKFVRALRDKAKMSPEQAEGFADAISEAIQTDIATKSDIAAVRDDIAAVRGEIGVVRGEIADTATDLRGEIASTAADLRSEIRQCELRLEAKIEATKAELLKWMFGTIGFQTLIILGAVIALARQIHP
ncbi:hypothetical protein A33M_2990 [Rhodovulum sp. PH10]|uniref:hypothetical protein n=1 Tax=Rhodovulum sp. PH10 TaxID=1187851 RepID=UPI00027C2CE4|nr:hypothetical protein [Rhodovulum sp. PH10]EJW11578.1 hypothetical protein A33M_2990 [Rhodovulum sp. PH10]